MDQWIIDLYDEYAHAPLDRRTFLDRLAALTGGTAAAMTEAGPVEAGKTAFVYMKTYVHAAGQPTWRVYGPSSNHNGGVVLHGYGDGHGKPVNESIDKNAYLAQVTRAGGEVVQE